MQVQDSYELYILIIDFISHNGTNADIYQLLNSGEAKTTPAQLRLVLRQMELENYINISYSNRPIDQYGFRQIAELRLML
jgi:hypothetical protein